MHTCDRRMGRRCPAQQRPVLGTCLLCHSWFSGCRARAAQTGEPRLARPWTATCTWGHRVCSKSGRRDAVCRQEGIPGTRGVQGRHGARQLAGQQDICHTAGRHVPMPLPCAQLSSRGPPTWGWPTLGQPARSTHRRDFRHPLGSSLPPPAVTSVLCKRFPRLPEPSTTSHDHLPSHVPPQKNLRVQTRLCPSAIGALPHTC